MIKIYMEEAARAAFVLLCLAIFLAFVWAVLA